ncbi:MAG TPA: hypothetical protein VGR80_13245 [Steroidobacteraceae bacterium]|nr:hypothetical protein [Steroidobacteraceae bacterium]
MHSRLARGGTACGIVLAALLILAGCSHLHWPWHRAAPPPPAAVHELGVSGSTAAPQYWKRNTLLIDLSAASGEGQLVLTPAAGGAWPVRLAFRVIPGSFGALEVRGAAREVLPITGAGAKPIDLELPPGIYGAGTAQITVSWGPQIVPAATAAP